MPTNNAAQLNDEERIRCEIRVNQDRLSSGQTQAGERQAGMPDRTEPIGTHTNITLDDSERTRCEIWTRVMGYHRPVSAWNAGKQAEHKERRYFQESHPRT